MFWQIGAYAITSYALHRVINREKIKFKKILEDICEKGTGFFNRQMETLKLDDLKVTEYGYEAKIGIPFGISYEFIENQKNLFETNFGAEEIIFTRDKKYSMLNLTIITKPFEDLKFKAPATKPHEIYLGYTHKNHIVIDLNKFPHLLISGCTGTGKSRLMLVILAALISQHSNDIELYMAQIRKVDLKVFEDCKPVKYFANDLETTCKMLEYLNNLCIKRDEMIGKNVKQGIYNIEDWNRRFKNNKMKYIYVVTDEFAFFMPSKADSKAEKNLKGKCLAYVKNIVLSGRSTGVFLFTSLQKPTSDGIPTDIKSQINIRLSFRQLDDPSSIAVLGNGHATELEIREAIVQTNQEDHIKVPFIDDKILKANVDKCKEKNHKFMQLVEAHKNTKISTPLTKDTPPKEETKEDKKQLIEEVAASNAVENGVVDLELLRRIKGNANK